MLSVEYRLRATRAEDSGLNALPDTRHVPLLATVLGPQAHVREHWTQWLASNRLDDPVAGAVVALLPAVYLRLRSIGADDAPEYCRLSGIYRYTWAQNQRVVQTLRRVDRLLRGRCCLRRDQGAVVTGRGLPRLWRATDRRPRSGCPSRRL